MEQNISKEVQERLNNINWESLKEKYGISKDSIMQDPAIATQLAYGQYTNLVPGSTEEITGMFSLRAYPQADGQEWKVKVYTMEKEKSEKDALFIYGHPITSDIIKKALFEKTSWDGNDGQKKYGYANANAGRPISIEVDGKKQDARHKIKGVAGSGKTQVLASRAVHSHLRTGKKVLILTFNITLCNYIRYRIGQIPADFLWNNFHIMTYYRFFTSQAKNLDLKLDLASYDSLDFFAQAMDRLPKYSAILIDEVQDYHTVWMEILQRYFLEDGGEFIVFGDTKQNIYKRPLDEQKLVSVPGILGRWNELKRCFRANNIGLLNLAVDFQKTFMGELPQDEIEMNPEIDYSRISYINLGSNVSGKTIFETCRTQLNEFEGDINKTVILSQTCEVIRDVEYLFRTEAVVPTSSMCETVEVYNKLKSDKKGNLNEELDTVRENKKHHFTMLSPGIKLSTVHSYKGWEAETVFLIIQPTDRFSAYPVNVSEINPEVIYTAITRSSKNLIVINLGVDKYEKFFHSHI